MARSIVEVRGDQLASRSNTGASTEGVSVIVRARFLRRLYARVREDLGRTHDFAYERVGFLSARVGNQSGCEPLIVFTDYYPVPDDQYIKDSHSGARINADAIRQAMQRVLDTGEGLFHVHCHAHRGKPGFGRMDLEETPRIVSCLQVAGPTQAHGMVLLSNDRYIVHVWMPGAGKPEVATSASVVGYPLEIFE